MVRAEVAGDLHLVQTIFVKQLRSVNIVQCKKSATYSNNKEKDQDKKKNNHEHLKNSEDGMT